MAVAELGGSGISDFIFNDFGAQQQQPRHLRSSRLTHVSSTAAAASFVGNEGEKVAAKAEWKSTSERWRSRTQIPLPGVRVSTRGVASVVWAPTKVVCDSTDESSGAGS